MKYKATQQNRVQTDTDVGELNSPLKINKTNSQDMSQPNPQPQIQQQPQINQVQLNSE